MGVYIYDKGRSLSGRGEGVKVGLTHVVKWCAKNCMLEYQEGA